MRTVQFTANSTRYLSTQGDDIWSWIPPRDKSDRNKDSYAIPTIKG